MDEGVKNAVMSKQAMAPVKEDVHGISNITDTLHKEAVVAPSAAAKNLGITDKR